MTELSKWHHRQDANTHTQYIFQITRTGMLDLVYASPESLWCYTFVKQTAEHSSCHTKYITCVYTHKREYTGMPNNRVNNKKSWDQSIVTCYSHVTEWHTQRPNFLYYLMEDVPKSTPREVSRKRLGKHYVSLQCKGNEEIAAHLRQRYCYRVLSDWEVQGHAIPSQP